MLKRFYDVLNKVSGGVDRAARWFIIVCLAIMTTTTTLQIICRYFFNASLQWPEELNVILMAWITYVGASIALRRSSHIGVQMVVDMLPRPGLFIAILLGRVAIGYSIIALIAIGYEVAMLNSAVLSDALGVPMAIPRLSLVVGGLMMIIQLVYLVANDIKKFVTKEVVS